jgi:hypothetical protein
MSVRIENPEDLNRLRDRARGEMDVRNGPKETRITVHMGTCGIAAGARDILAELSEHQGQDRDGLSLRSPDPGKDRGNRRRPRPGGQTRSEIHLGGVRHESIPK